MSSDNQIRANRENATRSTGPRTESGKQVSSRNNFRHGLASNQLLIEGEDAALLASYLDDHRPASGIERSLVESMTQHKWLMERAISLQNNSLINNYGVGDWLALYMRYQTTHERAFHRCLTQLIKLRAQRSKEQIGFESQKQKEALNNMKIKALQARIHLNKGKTDAIKVLTANRATSKIPVSIEKAGKTIPTHTFKPQIQPPVRDKQLSQ